MLTFFVAFWMILLFILTLPLLLVCYIAGLFDVKYKRRIAFWGGKIWGKLVVLTGFVKVDVIGKENIPAEPCLFVANHRSFYDIPVFYAVTPKLAGFVAKDGMNKVPLMSNWMKCLGCLFLNRENPREGLKTILYGIDRIKKGESLIICPEGTRGHNEVLGEFKEGSLKLSEKSGCPIVPVAFVGTDALFELNNNKAKPGKCTVVFGKPIEVKDLTPAEKKSLAGEVKVLIQNMYDTYK